MCLISQESHFMTYSFHICPAVLTLECWTLRQTCARRAVKVIDLCLGSLLNFLSHVCVWYLKGVKTKIDFNHITTIRLWFSLETSCAKILGRMVVK